MKIKSIILALTVLALFSCKYERKKTTDKKMPIAENVKGQTELEITPISHATAVLEFDKTVIYLDPTGGAEVFASFEDPHYIFITDIHGDHMNLKTLNALALENTIIIAPKAVAKEISTVKAKEIVVMNNGEKKSFSNFDIEAIPMYNLREEALKFHRKGRGNGYVLTVNEERIYFSGDTEDIPEMRNLKNIDKAFVCMNLPYTMPIENATSGVLAFKPKQVYPYHYRGKDGLSDISKFKELVNNENKEIEVVQLDWYPNRK